MIAIEDLLRLLEIEVVLAHFVPRQFGDSLDVTHDDRKLRTGRRNKIEPLQFALRLLHHSFRWIRFLKSRAQLLRLFLAAALASRPVRAGWL